MEEIEKKQFDFNDAVQQLLSGKNINGKDGILAPLVKCKALGILILSL